MPFSNALKSLLTSLFLILSATALNQSFAADRPEKPLSDRASLPVRAAPTYTFPVISHPESITHKPSINLRASGSASRSNPDVLGYTTFDYQHNCSMGRQVEHRGYDYVHFGWMAQDNDTLGIGRGLSYQAYDLDDCSYVLTAGGVRIESDYAGYVSLDADPGGWAVVGAHEALEGDFRPLAYWDLVAGGPAFGVFATDGPGDYYGWYQNAGTGPGNENVWPKIEWHLGTESILHMVTIESGGNAGDPKTTSYYRRIGPYGTNAGIWSDQRIIDTIMNMNPIVVASPVSDKVALVWNAPVDYLRDTPNEFGNQYENDVWYAVSTNQGADWAADTVSTPLGAPSIGHMVDIGAYEGANITTFNPMMPYKAYCDITALITTEDQLNIVFGCRRWTDTTTVYRRQSALMHWEENTPEIIRLVYVAEWDTGGPCFGHAWGSDLPSRRCPSATAVYMCSIRSSAQETIPAAMSTMSTMSSTDICICRSMIQPSTKSGISPGA